MKELRKVFICLRHFHRLVRGHLILIKLYSNTTVAYINKQGGTRSPSFCLLTLDLYRWCSTNNVQMKAIHVPGKQNLQADYLSRGKVVPKEWALHRRSGEDGFQHSVKTAYQPICLSNKYSPASLLHKVSSSNCMEDDGMNVNGYPPIALIRKVLAKLEEEPCSLLLITPLWPNQHWFQRLVALWVAPSRLLPEREDLLTF